MKNKSKFGAKQKPLSLLLCALFLWSPSLSASSDAVGGGAVVASGSVRLKSTETSRARILSAVTFVSEFPEITRSFKGEGEGVAYLFIDTRCPACSEVMREENIERILRSTEKLVVVFNTLYKLQGHKVGVIDALYLLSTTKDDGDIEKFLAAYENVKNHPDKMIADEVLRNKESALAKNYVFFLKNFALDATPILSDKHGKEINVK